MRLKVLHVMGANVAVNPELVTFLETYNEGTRVHFSSPQALIVDEDIVRTTQVLSG